MSESDGVGLQLDVRPGPYVACSTRLGVIRMWDVSKRDARQHAHPIMLRDKIPDFGSVLSMRYVIMLFFANHPVVELKVKML